MSSFLLSFLQGRPAKAVWTHVFFIGLISYSVGLSIQLSASTAGVFLGLSLFSMSLAVHRTSEIVQLWLGVANLLVLACGAFAWVLLVSHGSYFLRMGVVVGTGIVLAIVLRSIERVWTNTFTETALPPVLSQLTGAIKLLPAFGLLSVGLRGYAPLLPIGVALLVCTVLLMRLRNTLLLVFSGVIIVLSAQVSHVWSLRSGYWYFMSFDQTFRSAIATGLTRWGWNDSNLFAGVPFRYHWLAEASAGALSRLSGSDEYVVVTRVLPVLLFGFAIVSLFGFLIAMGAEVWPSIFGALIASTFTHPFDQYSIGTLFGLGLAYLALLMTVKWSTTTSELRVLTALVLLILMLFVAQAPLGLPIAGTAASVVVLNLIRKRIMFLRIALPAAILLVGLWILRISILAPASSAAQTSISWEHFLQFGTWDVKFGMKEESRWFAKALNSIGRLTELSLAALPALWFVSKHRAMRPTLYAGRKSVLLSLLVMSLVLVNLVSIGLDSKSVLKVLSFIGVVFLPLSVAFLAMMGKRWTLHTTTAALLGVLVAAIGYRLARDLSASRDGVLALPVVMTFAVLIGGGLFYLHRLEVGPAVATRHLRTSQVRVVVAALAIVVGVALSWEDRGVRRLSRLSIPTAHMLGSENFQSCVRWVRMNTHHDAIIASDMYFLPSPNLPAEKYSGVSAFSKRRVYLDAPIFVSSLDELEADTRDNLIDSGSIPIRGVDYYLVSQSWRTRHSDLPQSTLYVYFENADCAVIG